MSTEKMTITRGLVQLKLLDKRIGKAMNNSCFVDFKIGKKQRNENCDPGASLNKITSLIKRREAIKSAIMNANSNTIVKINQEEMTIMDAIEKKRSISYLEKLRNEMRTQLSRVEEEVNYQNERMQERLDKQLEEIYGKAGKVRDEDYNAVANPFKENNEASLVDPIEIKKKIEELDEYIDGFLSEVDLVLSEVNSQTDIEIEA